MRPTSGAPAVAGDFPPAYTPGPPAPAPAPRQAAPAAPEWEPQQSDSGGRFPIAGFVGAAVVGVLIGIVAVVVFMVLPDAKPKPEASPSGATASIAADRAPTDVKLDDKGSSVVISWTDHTGGTAPHYLVGGPEGASPRALTQVEKGVTEATIDALNPDKDYCFTVIAVISVDEVAPSRETCTERG